MLHVISQFLDIWLWIVELEMGLLKKVVGKSDSCTENVYQTFVSKMGWAPSKSLSWKENNSVVKLVVKLICKIN